MKIVKVFIVANLSIILLLMAACNAALPMSTPTPTAEILPPTGVKYQFVTNRLLIATTHEQAQAFALNIDGDAQNQADNRFGTLLSLIQSVAPNLAFQENLDQAVSNGQVVTLHMVQADDPLNDPSVTWFLILGETALTAPLFDGSDEFALNTAVPGGFPIPGSLTNGHFIGGPGRAPIQIYLLGQPVEVELVGVLLEADVSPTGCTNGKLGGGVTGDELKSKLLPAIADGLNLVIKSDQALANAILAVFDSERNGSISVEELENNPLLMLTMAPDLDLMDASGNFNPGQDGVNDSYSIGFGFTCVPAELPLPTDVSTTP
jgi:hypothetical protein